MIERRRHAGAVRALLRRYPVVGIVGPRQVGKTTLARQVGAAGGDPVHRFDLEDERDQDRLSDPMAALEELRGLVILDEVQHRPEIFRALRVLADRRPRRARFLILGSAGPGLLRQTTESLAGRIAYHELTGLDVGEVGRGGLDRLWLRGGFPPSFLAKSDSESFIWRRHLARSYLERDLPMLGAPLAAAGMRRFWNMLAHVHGQIWNSSEIGRSFGLSDKTVRGYLDFLADTHLVRILPPWHENLAKRQVRSPKVYFRDSGLFHLLSGARIHADLLGHPRCGASWEGFAVEEILAQFSVEPEEAHFWATHQGAELDLLVVRGRTRIGFEIKRSASPGMTPSIRTALADLSLQRLWVIHAGRTRYPLAPRVEAVPLSRLASLGRVLPI